MAASRHSTRPSQCSIPKCSALPLHACKAVQPPPRSSKLCAVSQLDPALDDMPPRPLSTREPETMYASCKSQCFRRDPRPARNYNIASVPNCCVLHQPRPPTAVSQLACVAPFPNWNTPVQTVGTRTRYPHYSQAAHGSRLAARSRSNATGPTSHGRQAPTKARNALKALANNAY